MPLSGKPGRTSFGFVQIVRVNNHSVFYAGRMSREGSISVVVHVPPALPNPVMLDGDETDVAGIPPEPWYKNPNLSSFVPPQIHSSWSDHPMGQVRLKLQNPATSNVDNFLFQYIDDADFWTIFTAQDPGGAPRYIAHFHWQVRQDFEFNWVGGMAQLKRSKSFFKMIDRNVKGRPMEADLQPVLTTPGRTSSERSIPRTQRSLISSLLRPSR